MRRRNWLIIIAFIIGLFVLAGLARPRLSPPPMPAQGSVQFSDYYRLDETWTDSLFVAAKTIDLGENSRVDGDVALVGDDITINGAIDGDVAITGDSLTLGPNAQISGDMIVVGGNIVFSANSRVDGDVAVSGKQLTIDPAAQVNGELSACVDRVSDGRVSSITPVACSDPAAGSALQFINAVASRWPVFATTNWATVGLASSALLSLILAGLGTLGVMVFPRHISHIEEAIRTRPRNLVVTGLMTFLAIIGFGAGFIVLLAVIPPLGVLLIPVLLILAVVFLGVTLAGLITLSIVFGEWLLSRRTTASWPPVVTAIVGSVVLSILLHLPVLVPYGGLISLAVVALLSAVAIGAALSTRLGTRPVRRSYFVQG